MRMWRVLAVMASLAVSGAAGASPAAEPQSLADCDTLVRAEPHARASWGCYYALARRKNLWDEATRRVEAGLALDPKNPYALMTLGNLDSGRSLPRAERLLGEAADGFASAGDLEAEILASLNLAIFLREHQRFDEADAAHVRAAAAAERSGKKQLLNTVRVEQGRQLARAGGDYGRALRLLELAEPEIFPDGPWQVRAACLSGLGRVYAALDRTAEMEACYRRLAAMGKEAGDRYVESNALANIAFSRLDRLNLLEPSLTPEAIALVRDALDAAVAGGNGWVEAAMHRVLGDLLQGPESEAEYEACLTIGKRMDDTEAICEALRAFALRRLREKPGREAEAVRMANEALELARAKDLPGEVVRSRLTLATMRWEAGQKDAALAESLACIDAVEALRDSQGSEGVREGLLAQWAPAYYRLAGRLLDPPSAPPARADLELASGVMERMRARTLRESIEATVLDTSAVSAPSAPERIPRSAVLPSLTRFHPATLAEIESSLAENQALLAFQIARWESHGRVYEGGSRLMTSTRAGTRVHALPDRIRIEAEVRELLTALGRRDGSEARVSATLFEELLKAALDELPSSIDTLVIVPDDILHELPFGALRESSSALPLASRFALSAAPSASLWLQWRKQGARGAIPALALADPSLGEDSPAQLRTWAQQRGLELGPLPYARQEARDLVGRLGGSSLLLVGSEATEAFIKGHDLTRYALVHFATHAVLDDDTPERSAIVLGRGGTTEDGLLQTREIGALDLGGSVVVLSACRSASGRLVRGEGIIGLARAFFQAGARTVVGSLWPIHDREAADLFRSFYRGIERGDSVASSLAMAQRAQIQAGVPAAGWAGVVILGDGGAVPLPGGRRKPGGGWGITVLVLLTAALLVLGLRRLRAASSTRPSLPS